MTDNWRIKTLTPLFVAALLASTACSGNDVHSHPTVAVKASTASGWQEPPETSPAAELAKSVGCVDFESQAHSRFVKSQGACRIGQHRIYVQTFASRHSRNLYMRREPPAEPGGVNVVAGTWIVRADGPAVANDIHAHLGGRLAYFSAGH
jgi:hypothetical protein